jgi:Cu(I)/Ag(I) efflux system membrane fusion protein
MAVAALLVALGLGYWWGRGRTDALVAAIPAADNQGKVLYWYDPMVPDQHFDKPGKSPFMDMPLLPKYADGTATTGVAVDAGVRQSLGIRTILVQRGHIADTVSVPGTIAWDLSREHVVSARVDAVVDRVLVRTPFERVRAGQPLASISAPAWSSALAEAQALRESGSAARSLQAASQSRLRALGLPSGAQVREGRILLVAPTDGVVSDVAAREGAMAPAGTLLYRINGTDTVWLEAAVPQAGVGALVAGTPVEARVSTLPGRVFKGRVEALLPQVDVASRTQQARIVLDNSQGDLSPGMFAQVVLHPAADGEQLLVPADAVIGDGAQARVIVQGQDGRFRPIRVEAGRSSEGQTEILSGLRGDERIVASGQFLIDSEASLSGALTRLGDEAADTSAPDAHTQHGEPANAKAKPALPQAQTPGDPAQPHTHKAPAR